MTGTPVRFRDLLVRLGPTFVKLGQFLALRPDILPQEYCAALLDLYDDVPPFPWEEARDILERELGAPPETVFAAIDPTPFASASLAQVHAARLPDGTEVAVKVQRPHLRERLARDLRKARLIARVWQAAGPALPVPPREIVAELREWLMQEVDFTRELANVTRMHRLMARSPSERAPRPFPEFSTARVLTTERLPGIRATEVLNPLRSDPTTIQARLAEADIDPDAFAANLIRSVLHQIFRFEFFHADVHPGNLLMLPGNVVGFVDFGLCDELDETVRQQQFRYLLALYTHDVEQMYRALAEILVPGDATDLDAFRADFLAHSHTWLEAVRPRDRSASTTSPIAKGLIEAMRLARRHDLKLPARILSMYRTLLGAETVANRLSDRADLRRLGRRFFRETRRDEVLKMLEPARLESYVISSATLARDAPGQLRQILSDLADDRFTVRVVASESARTRRAANRRARLVATAVVAVSLALLLSIPALPSVAGISLSWILAIALGCIYVSIVVQWRRLR